MKYEHMKFCNIISELDSEEKARAWIWLAKFDGKEFICPKCTNATYYQHRKKVEVRECKNCHFAVRLRANTIFQNSKIPLLIWLRAICLITQGKRGIAALELQSDLGMKSYDTAWTILHKIREALRQRDEKYRLKNIIELDGAVFGKRHTSNPRSPSSVEGEMLSRLPVIRGQIVLGQQVGDHRRLGNVTEWGLFFRPVGTAQRSEVPAPIPGHVVVGMPLDRGG